MSYNSKYTGEQVEAILDAVANGEAGGGGGGVTVETDPVFSASPAASITEAKKTEWDGKYTKPSGGIPASDLASDVFLQNSTYITDFNLQDLHDVYEGEVRQIRYEDLGNAILEKKRILVPSEKGFCLLTGESYGNGSEIYCAIYTSEGKVYILAIHDGIIDSEHTFREDLTEKILPATCGEINFLAEANGFVSQWGLCYALPDAASGDEDDILLSRYRVKTINGQELLADENSNDIITAYELVRTNLSSVELLPNTVTEWVAPITFRDLVLTFGEQPSQAYAVEYIAKFNVGADGVQLIVPDGVVWADGVLPAMTNGKTYEISFVDNLATFLEF